MEREKIRITFPAMGDGTGRYSVLVDYVFRNEGPSCKVAMGIPENDFFLQDKVLAESDRGLAGLTIRVDGSRLPVQRKVVTREKVALPEYNALSIVEVPFEPGQTRHVRVRYHSYMWGSCGLFMSYLFAGNGWKGRVGQTSVTMVNGSDLYYDNYGNSGVASQSMLRRLRGDNSHVRWNHWKPIGSFTVG